MMVVQHQQSFTGWTAALQVPKPGFVDQNDEKYANKTINLSCLADINLGVFWWLHGHQALSSGPTSHPTDGTQS
jgi:hypothetical protein